MADMDDFINGLLEEVRPPIEHTRVERAGDVFIDRRDGEVRVVNRGTAAADRLRRENDMTPLRGNVGAPELRATITRDNNAYRRIEYDARWPARGPLNGLVIIGMRDIARAIITASERDFPAGGRQVRVRYDSIRTGGSSYRFIALANPDGTRRTVAELADILDIMGNGESTHGSDGILQHTVLDNDHFVIEGPFRVNAGNGSRDKWPNDYYSLLDYRSTRPDDCLLTVVRQHKTEGSPFWPTGASETSLARGRTVRIKAGLPETGEIPVTDRSLEKLARYFGVGVTAIAAEPHVSERVFDDSGGVNRCRRTVEDIVLARGGCDLPKQIRVAIVTKEGPGGVQGHAVFVKDSKVPDFCPVTGDLMKGVKRSDAELCARVLEQGRPWHGSTDHAKPTYKDVVVVYDIETTFDPATGDLVPYLCGWYMFTPRRFADGDFSGEFEAVQIARGPRCVRAFVEFLLGLPVKPDTVRAKIVGFNSARFDNYLFAQELVNCDVNNFDVFLTGGALRGVTVPIRGVKGGVHTSLDLCRLLPGRLADMCKAFATKPEKQAGFDHTVVQQARMEGRLDAWLDANAQQAYDYLRHDVLSTASLYVKGTAAIEALTGVEVGKSKTGTIGGCAWEGFVKKCGRPPVPETREIDAFMRKCMTGGRVQCMVPDVLSRHERVAMVDVASLYPTACCAKNMGLLDRLAPSLRWGRFPEGQAVATPCYVPGRVGLYRVLVRRQPPVAVLPRRSETAPLDWQPEGEFETHCTHVEIEEIRMRCGEDAVEVYEGYYWKADTHERFTPFFMPVLAEKDRQDALKKEKSAEYNPALREACKLIVNSLTGKLAQRNFEEMCKVVQGYDKQVAAEKTFRNGDVTTIILGPSTVIMKGLRPEDKVYNARTAKPSYMSVFIYAYSRAYMYELLLSRYTGYYIDTDSYVMPWAEYERFRADYPMLDPEGRDKALGDLDREPEVGNSESTHCFFLRPKLYAMFDLEQGEWHPRHGKQGKLDNGKYRGKGIGAHDLVVHGASAVPCLAAGLSDEERARGFFETFMEPGGMKTYSEDPYAFFTQLLEVGSVGLLSGQLARLVEHERGFVLRQNYMHKTISLAERAAVVAEPEDEDDD